MHQHRGVDGGGLREGYFSGECSWQRIAEDAGWWPSNSGCADSNSGFSSGTAGCYSAISYLLTTTK